MNKQQNVKQRSTIILALALGVILAGCESNPGPKQAVGAAVGAALGGFAGSHIGKDEGQLAATAGGALLGAWFGSEIGKSLDRADRLAQAQATQTALESNKSGQATTWKNPDTGHTGTVTPVKTYEHQGRPCREFTQQVTIEGKTETVRGRACRDAQGWVMANAAS